jgi:probable phosphoglycerate mutase
MSDPTSILLIRHGQSTWNADGRWQGQADPPLTALGEAQASAAAAHVPAVDVVIASDLERAVRTATIIAEQAGAPVRVDERLREIDVGPWTGLTKAEIEHHWPGYIGSSRRPEGAESNATVAARARAALRDLHHAHPGQVVLVVAHSGLMRVLEHSLDTAGPVHRNLGGRWFRLEGDVVLPGDAVSLIDHEAVASTAPESL